ncbi:MAG: VTT domain-containing protein [Lacipirellulaceae bacterium]
MAILDFLRWLIGLAQPENLEKLVNLGGPWWVSYAILTAIIFSETGLLVGFFLPGDSLLFATGLLSSQGVFHFWGMCVLLIVAAIVGDAVNYSLGAQMGRGVFDKGRLRFVKRDHLLAAQAFYDKHGGKAIVLARFVPLVRTFTPFVAGVAKMPYRQFAFYNVTGGVAWVMAMMTAGYWLGQIPFVRKRFELIVIGIVVVSVLPIVWTGVSHWWARRGTLRPSETPSDG